MPTLSDAGTVLHTFNALRAVCSRCLATAAGLPRARWSAARERLIATATGQLSSAALHQPVRKATVYWKCLNAL